MDWIDRVAAIRRWNRNGYRAPHKPLLLLYALGHHQRHGARPISYSEAERHLAALLREFGPPRRTSPAYPFHHLASDGLWRVTTVDGEQCDADTAVRLRGEGARGSLSPEFSAALSQDPGLAARIARYLLDANFEPSLHAEICTLAGLDLESGIARHGGVRFVAGRRDPGFRDLVLDAYDHRCAFCGYDGWIDGGPVALEAAHVRWWALGGPDDLANGLCLCSIHHRLFDKGVLGLSRDHTVAVSTRFQGRSPASERLVSALEGRPLNRPGGADPAVEPDHVDWHGREVFRGDHLALAG
ncbi:phosphorothioated DNA-binding restriction endonuclease [Nocardiopsis sp. NPDC049922]|uniref:phosphorothioated DNA-binding restriction endonuclease n=1 Tax=Nocardiopsis sp. NPDC049922 TaxID=3155157 RepID=UPI0033F0B92F